MKRLPVTFGIVLMAISLVMPAVPVVADTTNLLSNPSVESLISGSPTGWVPNTWGSNTSTLSLSHDAHSGANSLSITTTSRTSGDSKWMPEAVAATAGHQYTYTDYYKSSIATELDAEYYDANNNVSYVYLQNVPASTTWQATTTTFTAPGTAVRMVVMHILAAVGNLTTDDFSLVDASAPTPPPSGSNLIANPSFEVANGSLPAGWQSGGWGTNSAQFAYATTGHTGTRSATVAISSYASGDAKWYFTPVAIQPNTTYTFTDYYKASVATSLVAQFDNGSGSLTYQTLSTIAPSPTWAQATASFSTPSTARLLSIFHIIAAVGSLQIDDVSLSSVTASAPVVTITNPGPGALASGTITLIATASAAQGIAHVQFVVDGTNVGAPVATTPYQMNFDTTSLANGSHTVAAVASANDGQAATSPLVQFTVNNTSAPGTNMIVNPSLETADPANAKLPQGWSKGGWGTNTRTFAYLTTGHSGTRSIKATITSFTDGSAYWSNGNLPVVGGQTYDFSDYYESNVMSEIDLAFTMNDGSVIYQYLGEASPSPKSWTQFRDQFTAPAGAVAVNIVHDIFAVGWVATDDYSLTPFSYQGFSRAVVSLTFDDAWASIYTNGLPLLQKYGFSSTQYIITGELDNDPNYMTSAMVKSLDAGGHEIASHTVTHPDLSTLSATKMDSELKNSQTFLQKLLGKPVADFASPYGVFNQQILTDAQQYYQSYRGVQAGYNGKNNFNVGDLMVQNVVAETTVADVQSWVAQAQATHTWLILVYHQVDPSPAAGEYNTYPADLDAQLAAIKASGISVETVAQALAELTPQL